MPKTLNENQGNNTTYDGPLRGTKTVEKPIMLPLERQQLKVGMVVQGELYPDSKKVSGCWKYQGKAVPFIITGILDNGDVLRKTLDGKDPDWSLAGCYCENLNKLYLVNNNKPADGFTPANIMQKLTSTLSAEEELREEKEDK